MSWIQKVHMENFGWTKELVYWTLTKHRHAKHLVRTTQQLVHHGFPDPPISTAVLMSSTVPGPSSPARLSQFWQHPMVLLHLTVYSTVQPSPATSPGFCRCWHSVLLHSAILPSLDPGSAWPSVCRQRAATLFTGLPSISTWPMAPLFHVWPTSHLNGFNPSPPGCYQWYCLLFYNHFLLYTFMIKHCSFLQFLKFPQSLFVWPTVQ